MRLLLNSTRGAGHFNPLLPFARAASDDVLVCAPASLADAVAAAGFELWPIDDPPEEELGAVWSRVPALPPDEQNAVVVGEIFACLNVVAALPSVRAAIAEFGPDLVLRETNAYTGGIAAELAGVPQARVAVSLSSGETMTQGLAASSLDEIRRANGLPADPSGEALRRTPYLTVFPESLEDPAVPAQPNAIRVRDPAWDQQPSPLPDWWGGSTAPLVYVTLGTVAGGFEQALPAYHAALAALDGLDVRVLLTTGAGVDPAAFDAAGQEVHIEAFVPQADVLPHAAAILCHGGSGTVLGALADGVPLVVMPLFADQPLNAARVGALGAGIAVEPDREQPQRTVPALREAVVRVLSDASFRSRAEAVAAEMRTHLTPAEALALAAAAAA